MWLTVPSRQVLVTMLAKKCQERGIEGTLLAWREDPWQGASRLSEPDVEEVRPASRGTQGSGWLCPERSEASDAAPLVPFADAAAPWSSCRLIPSSRSLSAIFGSPGLCALLLGSSISRSDGVPTGWEVVTRLLEQLATLEDASPDDVFEWYRQRGDEPDYSRLLE